MAGIGEASALLGVAQIGLQLAQTLIMAIGDHRDAAVNINRLRDEIHLTAICLQQLGDLAQGNRLIAGRGILEATNLRERCRAVIWEIRTVIKKGDNPLHPEEITKDDIDVSYFMAWKWALWTKKHLEYPRQELDRLKDSMTLTFVTHMAILANSEYERRIYTNQIPGVKRNVDWAEERWRHGLDDEQPQVPQEILNAGPEAWQDFLDWKNSGPAVTAPHANNVAKVQHRLEAAGMPKEEVDLVVAQIRGASALERSVNFEHQAWSLDPFIGRVKMPVTEEWLQNELRPEQPSDKMWKVHSKLQPWYRNQLDELINELKDSTQREWSLSSLKVVRRSFFHRIENPPSLQAVLRGDMNQPHVTNSRPQTMRFEAKNAEPAEAVPYDAELMMEERPLEQAKTDEEIIREQLAKYSSDKTN